MLGLALGAAVAVGAGATGYQSMAPTGQWFGRAFHGVSFRSQQTRSKQIALTFDDGPNDPHTLRLLEVLARHNVHATFFMIGRYAQQRPDIAAEVAKRGHIVGNHTFTHPLLTIKSTKCICEEITKCRAALTDAVGEHSNLFRPPWGARRPGVFRLVRQLGLEPIMWNVTGYDWNAPSADYVEQKVTRRVRGGAVVLLHDGGHVEFGANRAKTVQVVDRIISRYKAEGYEFVTVPEMMATMGAST